MEFFKQKVLNCIAEINEQLGNTTKLSHGKGDEEIEIIMKKYSDIFYTIKKDQIEDYNINVVSIMFYNDSFIANITTWLSSPREIYDETFQRYLPEGYLYDGDLNNNIFRFFLVDILSRRRMINGKYPHIEYEANLSKLKVASL
jgi:hypothetical protein